MHMMLQCWIAVAAVAVAVAPAVVAAAPAVAVAIAVVAVAAVAVTLWSKCAKRKKCLNLQPPGHVFEPSVDDHPGGYLNRVITHLTTTRASI